MSELIGKRKQVIKDIIAQLHKGLSLTQAKEMFQREVGDISSSEIFEVEQSLIKDGISPDEIKKFCNVHALLFEASLKDKISDTTNPEHPINLFKLENREIEKILANLKELKTKATRDKDYKDEIEKILIKLKDIEIHYTRKEQVLFPYLEKIGFFGPSKVMWGKDNEIRELLRKAIAAIKTAQIDTLISQYINPLIEEIEGMIFKEENILFPTALEKLNPQDWVEILKESSEVGYAFIQVTKDIDSMLKDLKKMADKSPIFSNGDIVSLPSGTLTLNELLNIFNTLPVDITFVDKDDTVKYYSEGKNRIFVRTRSVIGRKVQNCHPPQSLDIVEKILNSFKKGIKNFYEFWINFHGRLIYIRYFAVRDGSGNYLGTLEVTQDITDIQKIQGEKRLIDER